MIDLTVVRGDVEMTSTLTDRTCSSGMYGPDDLCLAYRGQAIGFLSCDLDGFLGKLVSTCDNVTIKAKHHGTHEGGWPILRPYLPDSSWFRRMYVAGSTTETYRDLAELHLTSSIMGGTHLSGRHTLSVKALPAIKGSSAKPRIELLFDGVYYTTVGARYGCYKALETLLDYPSMTCMVWEEEFFGGDLDHIVYVYET